MLTGGLELQVLAPWFAGGLAPSQLPTTHLLHVRVAPQRHRRSGALMPTPGARPHAGTLARRHGMGMGLGMGLGVGMALDTCCHFGLRIPRPHQTTLKPP